MKLKRFLLRYDPPGVGLEVEADDQVTVQHKNLPAKSEVSTSKEVHALVDQLIEGEPALLTRKRHREGLIQLLGRLYQVETAEEERPSEPQDAAEDPKDREELHGQSVVLTGLSGSQQAFNGEVAVVVKAKGDKQKYEVEVKGQVVKVKGKEHLLQVSSKGPLAAGAFVAIRGLRNHVELNGCVARVAECHEESQRYEVRALDSGQLFRVKKDNVILIETTPAVLAASAAMKENREPNTSPRKEGNLPATGETDDVLEVGSTVELVGLKTAQAYNGQQAEVLSVDQVRGRPVPVSQKNSPICSAFNLQVGKQKGVEVQLFAPINFDDRLLGFRAILEWAKDFKMMPVRVPRRQLERIFVTCHAGNMPSHEKFASKITYPEFLTLVTFCGNTGEPMDLSRVDGSRFRENDSKHFEVMKCHVERSLLPAVIGSSMVSRLKPHQRLLSRSRPRPLRVHITLSLLSLRALLLDSIMAVLSSCYSFFTSSTTLNITLRTMVLAALTSMLFNAIDLRLPVPAAVEELTVVVVLLALELGLSRRQDSTTKKSKPCPGERRVYEDVTGLAGRLQAAAKAGDTDAAEALMERILGEGTKPSLVCYGALISAFAKAGDVKRAEYWLEALEASGVGSPNGICLNMLISACAKANAVDRAEYWLVKMPSLGLSPDVMSYNAVIDACARTGDVVRAERWLEKMKASGTTPNVVSYSSVLHACARSCDASLAERWLERMSKEGAEPNAICYNAVINAWCKEGNTRRAAHWLEQMSQRGVQPTVNSYSTIIDKLAKAGDIDGAETWLMRMAEAGVEADAVSYNMLFSACSKMGDSVRAGKLFDQMMQRKVTPNTICFNLIINTHSRQGDFYAVLRRLRQMREQGIQADRVSFNTSLKAFSRCSDCKAVEKLLEEMQCAGVKPDVAAYNTFIAVCMRAKDASKAEEWLCRMTSAGVQADAVSYCTMIDAFAQSGDLHRAEKWLEKMERSGLQVGATTYGLLISTVAKMGDVGRVERIFERMDRANVEVNGSTYNALISACARKGDVDRAEFWLKKLLKSNAQADVASYSSVIHACAKANSLRRAEAWIEQMEHDGIPANVVTYNSVINACARCGDATRAEYWFQKMTAQGVQPGVLTFNSMVNACAKALDVDRAEKWLQEMPKHNVQPDDVSYSTVIHACGTAQEPERAEQWMKQMISSLSSQGEKPGSFCYNSIAQAWVRAGDVDRAMHWLSEAERLGVEVSSASLNGVVSALTRARRHSEVELWSSKVRKGDRGDRGERRYPQRLEQVKRLATFLCLSNSKKVKLHLHNAYRDTHFWKLSDGADFQKEARAAEMRSRPHYEVGCLEIDTEITAAKKFLEKFTWTNPDNLWEEFEAPFLDMGASVLNQKSKRFKLQIINRALVLAKLSIQLSNTGPLRLPWKDCMVGPGQHVNVLIDTAPIECGEWRGAIRVLGSWAGFFGKVEGEVRIPTYFRVQTQKDKDAGRTLPVHAPRPFRPGSANRSPALRDCVGCG
ncbi:PPR4 [Symbiodinium sp. CCMP2456]|nr:PPR4 [Symbiodinium sp. CCMP2456]